jgi:hypothetical protein
MRKYLFTEVNVSFGKRANAPRYYIVAQNIHEDTGKVIFRRIASGNSKKSLRHEIYLLASQRHAEIVDKPKRFVQKEA